jgi:hypothetical protein
MYLRYTAWLVLTVLTTAFAGCNKFTAPNQVSPESGPIAQSGAVISESGPVAQSGAVVPSGAIARSGPIAQSAAPSAPIAQSGVQSGAVVQSGAIAQSGPTAQSEAPSAPDPSYPNLIADRLKSTFKDYASYELFEISAPRWVSSYKGWNWLVCVRFVDRGRRRSYALLFNGSNVLDGHYAYQADNCGSQSYGVFEQMGGLGLPPLH